MWVRLIMDITRHCLNCGKYYFEGIPGEPCPFCGKKEEEFNPFKDIFGDDNPFSNLGAT